MSLPGFNAEASLLRKDYHYRESRQRGDGAAGRVIRPQQALEYGAYALCWYACLAGGGRAVPCGDYCREKWVR